MITAIEDLVIFTTPILILVFAAVIVCIIIENVFDVYGIFCVIAAVLTVALIVVSIVCGAKYQELLIALIVIATAQLLSLKLRAGGGKKDEPPKGQNTTDSEVKN